MSGGNRKKDYGEEEEDGSDTGAVSRKMRIDNTGS